MRKLVEQVSKSESTDYQKEAALEAIGYICSDIVSWMLYKFQFLKMFTIYSL